MDNLAEEIELVIRPAVTRNAPALRICGWSKRWWNDELREALRVARNWRKEVIRNPTEVNKEKARSSGFASYISYARAKRAPPARGGGRGSPAGKEDRRRLVSERNLLIYTFAKLCRQFEKVFWLLIVSVSLLADR
jgi:hypothetical protein